ncbi:MAG: dTDP-4-amino-4,6-dideoxygalactose transaminase [Verrucomicrobiaceae bacterium]|nr:dTDP-4-amino-4,6-dideoxygalactose transaminase [Verrucomicrobiaceae bacterium]
MKIPFNIPYLTGREEEYFLAALKSRRHCGNHAFGQKCVELMKHKYGFHEVFLTPSGTAALEMGCLLADIGPGDEVILPSYTFSSTGNAVVLTGAKPVFCEVDPDTMNADVRHMASLVTPRTKLLLPIDYAGIPCDRTAVNALAKKHGLSVLVDAAQSIHSFANGKPCGADEDMAAFSFHETKNLGCGEGGGLVVNRPEWVERARFLQEKGTDRSLVLSGVRSKYSWVDKGSSFLLADLLAALLLAQIEDVEIITNKRKKVAAAYHALYGPYEKAGALRIPHPPAGADCNGHAVFVIFDTAANRDRFLALLREKDVHAYIGYLPLHSSVMGRCHGCRPEDLPLTEDLAARIVRLPLYTDLADTGLDHCVEAMQTVLQAMYGTA